MAYSATSFRRIDGIPGQQLFTYVTADLASVFEASGYFDDAISGYGLATGDIVIVVCSTNGVGDLYVATDTSGTATVTQRT